MINAAQMDGIRFGLLNDPHNLWSVPSIGGSRRPETVLPDLLAFNFNHTVSAFDTFEELVANLQNGSIDTTGYLDIGGDYPGNFIYSTANIRFSFLMHRLIKTNRTTI